MSCNPVNYLRESFLVLLGELENVLETVKVPNRIGIEIIPERR
ncbi:MAG: hypothetical protein WCA32_07520 [Chromatiaceae bacterium]